MIELEDRTCACRATWKTNTISGANCWPISTPRSCRTGVPGSACRQPTGRARIAGLVTDHKEQPLSATTFEPAPAKTAWVDSASEGGQPRVVVIALAAAAAVLLIFVFFILPQLVTPDEVTPSLTEREQAAHSGNIVASGSVASDTGNERSPFAEAQESGLRRDAQEVLQSLLTLQESLAERGAAKWGEPTYGEALGHAAAGDTAYRERDFTGATAEYQLALDQLLALEASLPGRIEALYNTLVSKIENGDGLAAQARFTELAEMAPADIRLIALEDRLAALPAVIAALDTAAERARRLAT